jgi:hypothetical protein
MTPLSSVERSPIGIIILAIGQTSKGMNPLLNFRCCFPWQMVRIVGALESFTKTTLPAGLIIGRDIPIGNRS